MAHVVSMFQMLVKTHNRSSGFTLLEVLLAIVLISGGFVALLEALSTGLFAGTENENDLVAINLAQERIDEIRNRSYANIINEAKAVVSGFSAFQRQVVVTTPQTSLKQVNVTVYWYSKSSELNTSLVTYVSEI